MLVVGVVPQGPARPGVAEDVGGVQEGEQLRVKLLWEGEEARAVAAGGGVGRGEDL